MYIGIHVNSEFIAAATTNINGNAVLIKDESMVSNKPFMNGLKIYIEHKFVYLGEKVDDLLTNNYNLNYVEGFLNDLTDSSKTVYKDVSGTSWSAITLLAIFLKKIKTDIQIYDDTPIKGAVITLLNPLTPSLIQSLKTAFDIVAIPLNDIVPVEKAAMEGYAITHTSDTVKYVLLYYLDKHQLTITVSTLDKQDTIKNLFQATSMKWAEEQLYNRLSAFVKKQYEEISGKKIKENAKNTAIVAQLVAQLMNNTDDSGAYIPLLCTLNDEIMELIILKKPFHDLIKTYIEDTISFLKKELHGRAITTGHINTVLIAGNSNCFSVIGQSLKALFHDQHQEIYNLSPEEVLTKGTAICANNSTSDLYPTSPIQNRKDNATDAYHDTHQLNKLVNTLHINAGCEII